MMSTRHRHDIESRLVEALAREAERTPVAAAPVSAIRDDASRRGRRAWHRPIRSRSGRRERSQRPPRPWLPPLAVAASILALIGGVVVAVESGVRITVEDGSPDRTVAAPPAARDTVWRGVGRVGLPVPLSWRVSAGQLCPERQAPAKDTFNVDPPGRPVRLDSCFSSYTRRAGVESVIANSSIDAEVPTPGAREIELDGLTAFRTPVTCEDLRGGGRSGVVELCRGLVFVPEEQASITVTSTTDAQTVEDLLDQVRVLDDAAAVPWLTFDRGRTVAVRTGEYQDRVRGLGLVPRVRRVPSDVRPGTVLGLVPDIGTMLPLGSEVAIEVSRERAERRTP